LPFPLPPVAADDVLAHPCRPAALQLEQLKLFEGWDQLKTIRKPLIAGGICCLISAA
jgi:hypothetical protein